MEKKKQKNIWSWKIEGHDLKNQLDNYSNLKITESYRGISVLIVLALLTLSVLQAFFGVNVSFEEILYGLIIYVPILFFVYRGHRWAIVALMALWTFEKGYQLVEVGGIMPIIWWVIIMPYFYKALKVENERKKQTKTMSNEVAGQSEKFCGNCGKLVTSGAKFCQSCGQQAT